MLSRFNLKLSKNYFNKYFVIGNKLVYGQINKIKTGFQRLLCNDIVLSSDIEEYWFPQIQADIFLSHSHADYNLAVSLAGWLQETFKLRVFVDSCVWGQADELLREIDNKHCRKADGLYDYDGRNITTSHVHLILNGAIMKMIDNAECLFFLNTPNSLSLSGKANDKFDFATASPWIYSELLFSELMQKQRDKRPVVQDFSEKRLDFKIVYPLDIRRLIPLKEEDLFLWGKSYEEHPSNALNMLYDLIKYKSSS